jgi:hypothetical protein
MLKYSTSLRITKDKYDVVGLAFEKFRVASFEGHG